MQRKSKPNCLQGDHHGTSTSNHDAALTQIESQVSGGYRLSLSEVVGLTRASATARRQESGSPTPAPSCAVPTCTLYKENPAALRAEKRIELGEGIDVFA